MVLAGVAVAFVFLGDIPVAPAAGEVMQIDDGLVAFAFLLVGVGHGGDALMEFADHLDEVVLFLAAQRIEEAAALDGADERVECDELEGGRANSNDMLRQRLQIYGPREEIERRSRPFAETAQDSACAPMIRFLPGRILDDFAAVAAIGLDACRSRE